MLSATLMDSYRLTESQRETAETAFMESILSQSPDEIVLQMIIADNTQGLHAGVDHFEECSSAWSYIERSAEDAAIEKIGRQIGNSAHFEIHF